MDSIKSKMLSLSQATAEATARTSVFEEELKRNNEIADRFEEQVNDKSNRKFYLFMVILIKIQIRWSSFITKRLLY